jgi:hypothetical protein
MRVARYWHTRLLDGPRPRDFALRGGATVCGIFEDNRLRIGVAICSLHDPFSKKRGREEALSAAAVPDLIIEPAPSRNVWAAVVNAVVTEKMEAVYKKTVDVFDRRDS